MKRSVLIVLLIVMLVAAGCSSYLGPTPISMALTREPGQLPAGTLMPSLGQPASRNIPQLQSQHHAPVIAVTFSDDGQEVAAVSTSTQGRFDRWRVGDGALLMSTDLGYVWPFVGALNSSASQFVVVQTAIGEGKQDASFVSAVALWDAHTGERLRELWRDLNPDTRTTYLTFSRDGRSLAHASHYVRGTRNLMGPGGFGTGNTPVYGLFNDKIVREASVTDVMTFDSTGEWLAHADRDGTVMLEESRISGSKARPHYPFGLTLRGPRTDSSRVLALAFDPQRRWLAVLDQSSLEVYAVRSGRRVFHSDGSGGDLGALMFSPDGNLLAIGKAEGLEIRSTGQWVEVGQWVERPAYSIAFSPDGRLIATGDATGGVSLRSIQ